MITTSPRPEIETVKLHEIPKGKLDGQGQKEMHCGIPIVKKVLLVSLFSWLHLPKGWLYISNFYVKRSRDYPVK